jgi:hypothetical protein
MMVADRGRHQERYSDNSTLRFCVSHNASAMRRKVIASVSYRSGLREIVIASYSYCSSLKGIVIAYCSYCCKVTNRYKFRAIPGISRSGVNLTGHARLRARDMKGVIPV